MYPFRNLDACICVHEVVYQKLAIFVNSVCFCHLLRHVITKLRIDLPLVKKTTVLKEMCHLLKRELHGRCGFWFWFFFSVFNNYLLLSYDRAMQILVWPILWKDPLVSQRSGSHCQATHWHQAIKQLPFQTSVPPYLSPSSQAQPLGPSLLHLPVQECLWAEYIILSSSV